MTLLYVGWLGHFISLLNAYKRLWRDKTEEASVWSCCDQEPPSCLEGGAGSRPVSEEWGQAKLVCLSWYEWRNLQWQWRFTVPAGTPCRRCMTASPPALCNLLFPQPDWAVSGSPGSLLTPLSLQLCAACHHCEHALLQEETLILKISVLLFGNFI